LDEHVNHPKEVVQEGDVLTLRIIKIDSARRRMGLSLKRVGLADYAEQDWASSYAQTGTTATEDEPAVVVEEAGGSEVDKVSSFTSELSEEDEHAQTETVEVVAG
jgi:transcriptional accessory protein Tex/SPT6